MSKQECSFRGPYFVDGEVDHTCRTHNIALEPLDPENIDIYHARKSDFFCPANPNYVYPPPTPAHLKDALGQPYYVGAKVLVSVHGTTSLLKGTVEGISAKRIRVSPNYKKAPHFGAEFVAMPSNAVIVDPILERTTE